MIVHVCGNTPLPHCHFVGISFVMRSPLVPQHNASTLTRQAASKAARQAANAAEEKQRVAEDQLALLSGKEGPGKKRGKKKK